MINIFIVLFFTSLLSYLAFNSFSIINEGHVGVKYILGSLSTDILEPGLCFTVPLITKLYEVQVTVQTDYVTNVPCGTSSGITVIFEKIEVVNQLQKKFVYDVTKNYGVMYDKNLIFDKIAAEMNQFCSKHTLQQVYIDKFDKLDEILTETLQKSLDVEAPGVSIRSIRMSKPSVPPRVEENYREIVVAQTEMQKAKVQQEKDMQTIQSQNAKALAQLNSEEQQKIAQINATKNQELAKILSEQERGLAQLRAEEERKLAEIRASTEINAKSIERDMAYEIGKLNIQLVNLPSIRNITLANIELDHEKNIKYAEFQNKLFTKEYAAVEMAKYLSNNSKIYYGDSLPQMFYPLVGTHTLPHAP